jgi:hypothetical protein
MRHEVLWAHNNLIFLGWGVITKFLRLDFSQQNDHCEVFFYQIESSFLAEPPSGSKESFSGPPAVRKILERKFVFVDARNLVYAAKMDSVLVYWPE